MKTESIPETLPRVLFWLLPLVACALLMTPVAAPAQVPVDDAGNPIEPLDDTDDASASQGADAASVEAGDAALRTPEELEALVGPIALYPDKLLAIVLPASTYPLEIVQAARFLEQLADDSSLKPDDAWDDSVTALLNYPEVVQMMDKDIDWTWRLGEAVVAQQADVIAAVEAFRDRAYAAGNLKSDERQTVSNNGGAIEIQPVSEEVIYVPYYEPERVVHYQPRQVYYYYDRPYPVYYYPYPVHHSFFSGYFWGVTTAFNIGWATDHLHVYHHSYWGHPYYGRHYYGHYYRRPSITVYNQYYVNHNWHRSEHHHRDGDYWRPRDGGARPGHYSARLDRFRDHPREHTVDGYRIPDRNARRTSSDRTGFRSGDVANRNGTNDVREGFAATRNGAAARDRVRVNPADRARSASGTPDNDTIRFRTRERNDAAADAQRNRVAGSVNPAAREPERSATTRLAERRDGNDTIRFRSRERSAGSDSSSAASRSRSPASSSGSGLARAAESARSGSSDRSSRSSSRDPTIMPDRAARSRTAAPPAARSAPSTRTFRSSPGQSEAAPRSPSSRPQTTQRSMAPRSAPPRASAPAQAPRAAAPAPRESRAAPRSHSNSPSSRPRSRD